MCGVAGIRLFEGCTDQIDPKLLDRMRDTMTHRGPDGSGTWLSSDGRMGLAHRRLSIIDLSSAAAQPMSDATGNLCVSFNGEIYNHADLRKELQRLGRNAWKTDHSDTEVILQAYAQWGISCVTRFRGMFAFALWDGTTRDLWLVRDRLGIKPLYYTLRDNRVAFASEIKALLADSRQPRVIDEEALFHYLSFLTTPAPMTMFRGVRKLRPGTYLRVTGFGAIEETRYWDLWDHATSPVQEPEEETAARIRCALEEAVRVHKVSDVPIGVFLSGGIDSSTNAALFSRGEERPVRTFSIGYEGDYPSYKDELAYARGMAVRIGSEHHERRLRLQDLLEFLPHMVRLQDEPLADPVCVPVYYVSKLARDSGVAVCQVGEGADELFAGYPSWRTMARMQRMNHLPVPRAAKRALLGTMRRLGRDHGFPYEWLSRGSAGLPVFWGGAEAFTDVDKREILGPRLKRQFADLSSWEPIKPLWDRFKTSAPDPDPLNWMAYLDLNLRLPELLLMRVDKMSMAVSLETRVPFLDHKFVEMAMSLSPTQKLKGGQLKRLLKLAVRNVIPDEVINRPKQGFGVPLQEWVTGRLGEEAKVVLSRFCERSDYLDPAGVVRVLQRSHPSKIWYLLNLALWWEAYVAA